MSAILDTPKRTRQRRHEAPPVLFYAHVRLLLVSSPASGEVAPRRDRLVCLRRKRRLHSPANFAATDSLLLNLKYRRVIAMGKTSCFNDPNRGGSRSEESRVGKECRSRWSPYHLKKNIYDSYYEAYSSFGTLAAVCAPRLCSSS